MSIIFPKTGGLPLAKRSPERKAYRLQELSRWSKHLNIPIILEPKYFPVTEWPAAAIVIFAQSNGIDPGPLVSAFLSAVWVEERNIADHATIIRITEESGFNGQEMFDNVMKSELKAEWERNSLEALIDGVFGVPTYKYGKEIFWGQDRLEFLERTLSTN